MNNSPEMQVYHKILEALDQKNWRYKKSEETLTVEYKVKGNGMPAEFIIQVDEKRNLIGIYSPCYCSFGEELRVEGALATCYVTDLLVNGGFDYNFSDGQITFRAIIPYVDCDIDVELISDMIDLCAGTVIKYNDIFFEISKGYMTLEDYIADRKASS